MKEKRVVVILLVVVLLFSIILVIAQEEDNGGDKVQNAYDCLAGKLGDNCGGTTNTEQAAWSLFAMAWNSSFNQDCQDSLIEKQKENCWGKTDTSNCNIRATSIAILALNHIGVDTGESVNWLISKRKLSRDLEWYLEIDANNETRCEITSGGRSATTITILENKKITGPTPSGLAKAYNDYWFRITNIERNFTISCDQNFITTLFYKRPGGNVFYIPGETHAAPAGDLTEEKVTSYCFSLSSRCDYEGSLWAALALQNSREDASPYLPYLTTLSEESSNRRYFPSTFLYLLTASDDYYSTLVEKQKQSKYWKEGSDKFYDTALALLSLQGTDAPETDNAREHLLDVQDSNGCWGANTAFLLYAGWPRAPLTRTSTSDEPSTTPSYCTDNNYYCVASTDCELPDQLDYYCPAFNQICCINEPQEQTCTEKGGSVCPSDQVCSGSQVPAADTTYCCIGLCEEPPEPEENLCDTSGYFCREECGEGQMEKESFSSYCYPKVCCATVEPPTPDPAGNWIWIIILIILILLVVLGIVFRDKLRMALFKKKTRARPGKGGRPGVAPPGFGIPPGKPPGRMPPPRMMRRPPPGRPLRRPPGRPVRRPASRKKDKDKEFEETMKKLREMSK